VTSEIAATPARVERRVAMIGALAAAVAGIVTWTYWSRISVAFAPVKSAVRTRSAAALAADDLFWRIFHSGDYEGIPSTLEVVNAAYLQTPGDAIAASHIAWLHFWRVAERRRLQRVRAIITDDVLLARRYFEETVRLNPHDASSATAISRWRMPSERGRLLICSLRDMSSATYRPIQINFGRVWKMNGRIWMYAQASGSTACTPASQNTFAISKISGRA
jgi:hypothetical protein